MSAPAADFVSPYLRRRARSESEARDDIRRARKEREAERSALVSLNPETWPECHARAFEEE